MLRAAKHFKLFQRALIFSLMRKQSTSASMEIDDRDEKLKRRSEARGDHDVDGSPAWRRSVLGGVVGEGFSPSEVK